MTRRRGDPAGAAAAAGRDAPRNAAARAAMGRAALTEREVEVLRPMARGLSNAENAEQLVIRIRWLPVLAGDRRAEYDPPNTRASWEDGRWGG